MSTPVHNPPSLQWQSRLILLIVVPSSACWLLLTIAASLTRATAAGLLISLVFALLVWRLRAASALASLIGGVLCATMYLATVTQPDGSWRYTALAPGLTLFVLAFAATRFRRDGKQRSTAEARHGRSAAQVVANLGIAALAAIFAASHPITARVALIAALAEAAADTVSSELGEVLGGTPRLITNFRRVPAGTDGGISLIGSAAGAAAALILVCVGVLTLRLDTREAVLACSAAVAGLFADSLLGALVERRGALNNDAVNFLSTFIAALLAVFALRLL